MRDRARTKARPWPVAAGKPVLCEKPIDLSLPRVTTCAERIRGTGGLLAHHISGEKVGLGIHIGGLESRLVGHGADDAAAADFARAWYRSLRSDSNKRLAKVHAVRVFCKNSRALRKKPSSLCH